MAFERVRLRKAWAALEELGLTNDKLALSAARLGRAREALEAAAEAFGQTHVALHGGIYASVGRDALRGAPVEIRIRVLSCLLEAFGGEGGVARLAQVEVLEEALNDSGEVVRTLGGCLVSAGRKLIRVFVSLRAAICRRSSFPGAGCRVGPAFRDQPRRKGKRAGGAARVAAGHPCARRARLCNLKGPTPLPAPSRPVAALPALWSGTDVVGVPDLIWPQPEPTHDTPTTPLINFRARFVGGRGFARSPI